MSPAMCHWGLQAFWNGDTDMGKNELKQSEYSYLLCSLPQILILIMGVIS